MKGDLAFMPRWNLLVLPWCQWRSVVALSDSLLWRHQVWRSPQTPTETFLGAAGTAPGPSAIQAGPWDQRLRSRWRITEKSRLVQFSLSDLHWKYSLRVSQLKPSIICDGKNGNYSFLPPFLRASKVVLMVKNLPANAGDIKDEVWSLGQEDPLE